ncbi:hypothetical protein NDI52_07410 [Leptolyngbya sp. PL-A3]|uniref:hypothetical protein n=1 Tax=Leptolyngbya sp. PL-A3 TaxID=2933911 RepID=UPI00329A3E42
MQQALVYADALQVPFVFSSNGDAFLLHDRSGTYGSPVEREIPLEGFPSPDELWQRYKQWQQLEDALENLLTALYFVELDRQDPCYSQQLAVNRTIEAIALMKVGIFGAMPSPYMSGSCCIAQRRAVSFYKPRKLDRKDLKVLLAPVVGKSYEFFLLSSTLKNLAALLFLVEANWLSSMPKSDFLGRSQ